MREQAWQHSGPLVLNGPLGSGLLFLAMLFVGAVNSTILLAMLLRPNLNPDLSGYGRSTTQTPISSTPCGWQRIHAVGEYRRAPHLGHVAVGLLSRLSRCADSARGSGGAQVVSAPVSYMGPVSQRRFQVGQAPDWGELGLSPVTGDATREHLRK